MSQRGDSDAASRAQRPAGRRSVSRLFAVQALYEIAFSGSAAEGVIQDFKDRRLGAEIDGETLRDADPDFFAEVVRGTAKRQEEIDAALKATLPRAEVFDRMEAILKAALRAAVFELLARIDVPAATVIDEYLGVLRAFYDSPELKLGNGILDGVSRRLRPNEFQASGAGT
jgi:N utilization substance protein B